MDGSGVPTSYPARPIGWPADLATGGMAIAGVLTGHALTYVMLGGGSDSSLVASGHGYLGAATRIGSAVILLALVVAFAGRFRQALAQEGPDLPSLHRLAARLGAAQVAMFAVQEVAEQSATGADLGALVHRGILPIGVLVQVALAVLGALLLARILRTADALGRTLGRSAVQPIALDIPGRPPRTTPPKRDAGALIAWTLRGPPCATTTHVPPSRRRV